MSTTTEITTAGTVPLLRRVTVSLEESMILQQLVFIIQVDKEHFKSHSEHLHSSLAVGLFHASIVCVW